MTKSFYFHCFIPVIPKTWQETWQVSWGTVLNNGTLGAPFCIYRAWHYHAGQHPILWMNAKARNLDHILLVWCSKHKTLYYRYLLPARGVQLTLEWSSQWHRLFLQGSNQASKLMVFFLYNFIFWLNRFFLLLLKHSQQLSLYTYW